MKNKFFILGILLLFRIVMFDGGSFASANEIYGYSINVNSDNADLRSVEDKFSDEIKYNIVRVKNNVDGELSDSLTMTTSNAGVIGRGDNGALGCLHLSLSKPSYLSWIKVKLSYATRPSDIVRLKLYEYEKSERFDPRNPGVLIATGEVNSTDVVLYGVDSLVLSKGMHNLWLVADVSPTAREGHIVTTKVEEIKLADRSIIYPQEGNVFSNEIVLMRTLVWSPGDEGAYSYRIPAVVRLNDGSLVASVDRRKKSSNDLPGDIDVEVKISHDEGLSWSSPITVAKGTESHGYGDAAMATDGKKIYMVMVGGQGLWANDSTNTIQMYYTKSVDGGNSWSPIKNITSSIKANKYPFGGFFGSGNGIVTSDGKICFVAAMRTDSIPGGNMDNVLVYSDDRGLSWHVSPTARHNGDESKVVELHNGNLLISSRNRARGANARTYMVSSDKGLTWSEPRQWQDLMGNACDAGIARYILPGKTETNNYLLHTLPADGQRRKLSIFLSRDGGQTWPISKVICHGESAYSEIVILPDGNIGIISEEKEHPAYDIYFTKVSFDWLTRKK